MEFLKKNVGLVLLVFSLAVYTLIKLPLNLSVVCPTQNEGFYFIYGQNLLNHKELMPSRGIVFIGLYSLVLKIFGFNTSSIIAMNFLQTLIVILIGILIFLIVKEVTQNSTVSSLGTTLWLILISTPLGKDSYYELRSHYAFEAEYLCVLFGLLSVFLLLKNTKSKIPAILSGIFAIFPVMSKASGFIFPFSLVLFFLTAFIFKSKTFILLKDKFIFWFLGTLLSFTIFQLMIYSLTSDWLLFWKINFLVGSYSKKLNIFDLNFIMNNYIHTGGSENYNNLVLFIIFLVVFILAIFITFKSNLSENNSLTFWLIFLFLIPGSLAAILAPGVYEPYYYHFLWAPASLTTIVGLYDLSRYKNKIFKICCLFLVAVLLVVLSVRIAAFVPVHLKLIKTVTERSIFNQPQSFQDPVKPYDSLTTQRSIELQIADRINSLLPNKDGTLYILNFPKGLSAISPNTYIYAKRCSATSILSDFLLREAVMDYKINALKNDLLKRPPNIFIISKEVSFSNTQKEYLLPFIVWLKSFLEAHYKPKTIIPTYVYDDNKTEEFVVYKRV